MDLSVLLQAPGVGEMIPECGPFQWFMPVWRGWSVRTHSRIEESEVLLLHTQLSGGR
ncbi:hypothetical protein [Streptomyces sp. WAC 01529]|uniref:hypothetical protein n=1 Tax=Streptomyces sp. WAC 01529 TaxID=2203205 RepID=UPI0013DF6778|nr:hypothetical protein [Streptomyces sp. WAC 01529]